MKQRSFDQSDRIRLNLEWLDRQTQSETPIAQKIFSSVPLMPLCLAFIAGIIIAYRIPTSSMFTTLFICLPVAFLAITCSFMKIADKTRLLLAFISAIVLFICLGTGRVSHIRYQPPHHISHFMKNQRQLATLRGKIVSPVQINDSNRKFSSIPWLNSKSSFYLAIDEIKTASGWQKTTGKVRVQIAEPIHHVHPGNDVQIYCWLSRFSRPPNPGQFNLQKHMHNRGVFVAASVSIKEGVEVLDDSHSIVFGLRSLLYHFASNALLDETMTDPDVQSLASALLLGRRSSLEPVIVSAFQKTNLAHFISLSGMHVGILAGSLWILLRTAQIPKRSRAIVCIILILVYALIVPPRAPTMRAVFLSCFFFASAVIGRRVNPLNTLALSAIVLLFARPYELFSAGWQLSFLSVLGILLFYKSVQYHLLDQAFYPLVELFNKRFFILQHFLYRIIELLSVGISAWIVIAPVLLYYFGKINPLSPLWTVLVFPVVLILLYAGFLKIVLSQLLPTLASLLGVLLNLCAKALEKAVLILAKVDLFQITSHRPGLSFVLLLYLLLATAYFIPRRYRRTQTTLICLLVGTFLLPCLSHLSKPIKSPALQLTCLSIGHGQAIVLSTPTDKDILFDAGSITNQDIARKTILPFLQHHSIFDLDAIYISHGDLDHLNAIPDVAAAVPIGHIYGNTALLDNAEHPSLEKQFKERLEKFGYQVEQIQDRKYDDVIVQSLWPTESVVSDSGISENDRSEVLLITYAGRKILLCGDIEYYGQDKFLEHYPSLRIDVMVLPHHGSTTNLDTRFIEQLSPAIVIASCSGKNAPNAWHTPSNARIKAFYTAVNGAVTIKIKADGALSTDGFLNSNK